MNYLGRTYNKLQAFYYEINPATLTGAIDVVVVQHEDGSFRCSPFHVRFGKLALLKSKDLCVDIEINGKPVDDLHMMLGEAGEAYFVQRHSQLHTENDSATGSSKSSSCESLAAPSSTSTSKSVVVAAAPLVSVTVPTPPPPPPTPASTLASTESESVTTVGPKPPPMMSFFSDGEITPELTSPAVSRPPSPKSDTEVDRAQQAARRDSTVAAAAAAAAESAAANQWSWSWGKLPERNTPTNGDTTSGTTNSSSSIKPDANNNNTATNSTTTTSTSSTVTSTNNTTTNSNISSGVAAYGNSASKMASNSSSRLLGGMFNLIGSSSSSSSPSNNVVVGGTSLIAKEEIYLDETEKLDSEVAALYLNQKSQPSLIQQQQQQQQQQSVLVGQSSTTISSSARGGGAAKDDDAESGNGHSLPQSPVPPPPPSQSSSSRGDYFSILGEVQISLCGGLPPPPPTSSAASSLGAIPVPLPVVFPGNRLSVSPPPPPSSSTSETPPLSVSPPNSPLFVQSQRDPFDAAAAEVQEVGSASYEELFQQYAVSFDKFVENIQSIVHEPNLVVKLNQRYMTWAQAAPVILAALVYHKPLPGDVQSALLLKPSPSSSSQLGQLSQQATTQQSTQQQQKAAGGWRLFKWRGKATAEQQQPAAPAQQQTVKQQTASKPRNETSNSTTTSSTSGVMMMDEDLMQLEQQQQEEAAAAAANSISSSSSRTTKLTRVKSNVEINSGSSYFDTTTTTSEKASSRVTEGTLTQSERDKSSKHKVQQQRTTRLSSEQIARLNLNSGANEITYSVTTALQGTTRITSEIFLWNYDDKIVVSDIDGTITKSDVLGQVLPILGRDWTQAGIADLYSGIEKNQYKFMYLSARAIGQSRITRNLLKNVNQGGLTLPRGPLLITPSSLFAAFHKEVIEKKPEEFKISCLGDIQSLFPTGHSPFYAGYGNKSSDVTAYKAVGIPTSRIFTINPQGELKHEVSRAFQSSYSKLCDFVDLIFPPVKPSAAIIKADYDSFNFWRQQATPTDSSLIDEIEQEVKRINSAEVAPNATNSSNSNSSNLNQSTPNGAAVRSTTSSRKVATKAGSVKASK